MSIPRRKEPMANLIREHRMTVAHMNALVSGRAIPTDEEDDDMPEHFACRGCGDEMSAESYEVFNGLCRSCEHEQAAEAEADARRDDYD